MLRDPRLWSLGLLLLAAVSCTSSPLAPGGNTTTSGVTPTGTSPGLSTTTPRPDEPGPHSSPASTQTDTTVVVPTPIPAPLITGLALSPTSVELNDPYSFGAYQTGTMASLDEMESAGYPTSIQLWPTVVTDTGAPPDWNQLLWTSSNPELVAVDSGGMVRTVDPGLTGTASVTVMLRHNPSIKASTLVTVRNDGKLWLEIR